MAGLITGNLDKAAAPQTGWIEILEVDPMKSQSLLHVPKTDSIGRPILSPALESAVRNDDHNECAVARWNEELPDAASVGAG